MSTTQITRTEQTIDGLDAIVWTITEDGEHVGHLDAHTSGLILNGALVAVVASAKSDVTSVKVMINRPHDPSDVS